MALFSRPLALLVAIALLCLISDQTFPFSKGGKGMVSALQSPSNVDFIVSEEEEEEEEEEETPIDIDINIDEDVGEEAVAASVRSAARWARMNPSTTFDQDRILSLPGTHEPFHSTHYSGYLDLSASKKMHYIYIESESNPETDPIVFWSNGGPGCSGILGLFNGTLWALCCLLFIMHYLLFIDYCPIYLLIICQSFYLFIFLSIYLFILSQRWARGVSRRTGRWLAIPSLGPARQAWCSSSSPWGWASPTPPMPKRLATVTIQCFFYSY